MLSRIIGNAVRLVRNLQKASKQSGKSARKQIEEIIILRKTAVKFGVDDYFDYRLFDDGEPGARDKNHVAGWRMEHWLDDVLNPAKFRALVFDKLNAYACLRNLEIPIPDIQAVYHRTGRVFPGAIEVNTTEDVAALLRGGLRYPVFAKPVYGDVGSGAVGIERYDRDTDQLTMTDGTDRTVRDLSESLDDRRKFVLPELGYLFQSFIRQAPEVTRVAGPTVCSARLVILIDSNGPTPLQAIWRIATGCNMVDNFQKGRSGNLIASIDIESGRIVRCLRSFGLSRELVELHPNTGEKLVGFLLPNWREAVDYCIKGAKAFPMLKFQHWDIAFGIGGPVILELNATGSIDMVQFATGRGLFDNRLRSVVESRIGRRTQ